MQAGTDYDFEASSFDYKRQAAELVKLKAQQDSIGRNINHKARARTLGNNDGHHRRHHHRRRRHHHHHDHYYSRRHHNRRNRSTLHSHTQTADSPHDGACLRACTVLLLLLLLCAACLLSAVCCCCCCLPLLPLPFILGVFCLLCIIIIR